MRESQVNRTLIGHNMADLKSQILQTEIHGYWTRTATVNHKGFDILLLKTWMTLKRRRFQVLEANFMNSEELNG